MEMLDIMPVGRLVKDIYPSFNKGVQKLAGEYNTAHGIQHVI